MKVINKTEFSVNTRRLFNNVPVTSSFSYQATKQRSYAQRAYYQFRLVEKYRTAGSYCIFFTLTYAPHAVPQFFGFNVHDYRHIRQLLTGRLRKLCYKSNAKLDYFITSELGEGKGTRGYNNNPHYHVIFYVTPLDVTKDITISSSELYREVMLYWQGFYIDKDNKVRVQNNHLLFRYGRCYYNKKLGLQCYDYKSSLYASKYTIKDSLKNNSLYRIIGYMRDLFYRKVSLDDKLEIKVRCYNLLNDNYYTGLPYDFAYINARVNALVDFFVKRYYSKYYKPRTLTSNVFGAYALDFVDNDNITIKMPNKVGLMQSESLFGYLNRKFCYTHLNKKGEVIRNSKGNVCYVHTKRYINARYNNYEKNIDKIVLAYRKALNWFVTTLNAEVGLTDDDLRKIAYYNYTYRFRLLSYEQFNKLTYEPQADDLMFNLDSILMLDKKEQFVQGVYLPFTSFFTEHEYYATMLDSVLERYQFVGDSERYVKYENVKRARQRLAGLSVVHY